MWTLTEELPDTSELPEEDRVRARINTAIKNKVLRARTLRFNQRVEEPVVTDNLFRDTPDIDSSAAPRLGGALRDFNEDADEVIEEAIPSFSSIRNRAVPPAPALAAKPVAASSVVKQRVQKPVKQSVKAMAEAQPSLFVEPEESSYETPPLSLLASPDTITAPSSERRSPV